MRIIKLSDNQINEITKQWSDLPEDIKNKYKNIYFNMVDKRIITDQSYKMIQNLIKKNNPSEEKNNVQYVDYNEGQFRYMDKLYAMNKPQNFISNLIEKAKEKGKLTKSQNYYLMYYLKNGETPYDTKLLPNNI